MTASELHAWIRTCASIDSGSAIDNDPPMSPAWHRYTEQARIVDDAGTFAAIYTAAHGCPWPFTVTR
jgi:hypothetical protein